MGLYPKYRKPKATARPMPQPGPMVTRPFDIGEAREAAACAAFEDHFQPKAVRA